MLPSPCLVLITRHLHDRHMLRACSRTASRSRPVLYIYVPIYHVCDPSVLSLLVDGLLDLVLDLALELFGILEGDPAAVGGVLVLGAAPHEDAGALGDADDAEEEVHGGEEVVLRGDDEAPPGPDEAGGGQSAVLSERELLGRAGKVGHAGQDEGPFHDWGPEVDSLEADRASPHALEPARLGGALAGGGTAAGRALEPAAGGVAEGCSEGGARRCCSGAAGGVEGGPRGAEERCGGGHFLFVCRRRSWRSL